MGSTGVLSLRPPGGENYLCGVVIAVTSLLAHRTHPSPDTQAEFVDSVSARRTRLARGQPARNLVHRAAVSVSLLIEKAYELAPPRIANCTRESAIADHPRNVQVFDVDHLVLANQRKGLLMEIIPPGSQRPAVLNGYWATSLLSIG